MKTIEKIFDKIDSFINCIIIFMVFVMFFAVGSNVTSRWVIGRSLGELDEIALVAFIWVIYTGIGKIFRENGHIKVDFILTRLPKIPRAVLTFVNSLISIATCGAMAYYAYSIMKVSLKRALNVSHIPFFYLHISILIGFTTITIYLFADLIEFLVNLFQEKIVEGEVKTK